MSVYIFMSVILFERDHCYIYICIDVGRPVTVGGPDGAFKVIRNIISDIIYL